MIKIKLLIISFIFVTTSISANSELINSDEVSKLNYTQVILDDESLEKIALEPNKEKEINAKNLSTIINRTDEDALIRTQDGQEITLYTDEVYRFSGSIFITAPKKRFVFKNNKYKNDIYTLKNKGEKVSFDVNGTNFGSFATKRPFGLHMLCTSISAQCIDQCYFLLEILPPSGREWEYRKCLYRCEQRNVYMGKRVGSDCKKKGDKGVYW